MEKNDNAFVEKVESLLDDLFDEDDQTADAVEESSDVGYYPLRFLKATVLSIDWEITDEIMARFIEQVERLKTSHHDDKTILPLLQMLGSVGQHIRIFKENSHPNAIKMLKSLYVRLEQVVIGEDMPESEKNRILFREIRKFKALKAQIVAGNLTLAKTSKVKAPAIVTPASPQKEPSQAAVDDRQEEMQPSGSFEAVLTAIEDLKGIVLDEIGSIRNEISQLKP
jgi:hypothetical protein